MNIKLVSQDRDLYKLCRDILAEIPGGYWNISVAPEEDGSEAELCLWDFHPEMTLPEHIEWSPSKHLVLVARGDVPMFHERTGAPNAHLLLKPVTRATLATFLGLAVSAYQDRISTASSLRADRDEILQCLIQTN